MAHCSQCGGFFGVDDMIRHGNAYICAGCKPVFMQKLAEGAEIATGEMCYAGFWRRFGAVFLDGIILLVPNGLIQFVAAPAIAGAAIQNNPIRAGLLSLGLFALQMAINLSYEVLLIGRYGATLGKTAARIKVVTADGGGVSYARALGRYFAKILSSVILLIGYIIAAFDTEKRALHDRLCNTRVILK
jgi:uncharacterized RDD family membrane protein YckC